MQVKQWTEKTKPKKNPLLSRVKMFAISGWPTVKLDAEFQPFLSRQQEISFWMVACCGDLASLYLLWVGDACWSSSPNTLMSEPNEKFSLGICLVAESGC